LKFASRAKAIRNNAIVNEVLSDDALLKRYRTEINELKRQKDLLENGAHVEELKKEKNMLAEEVRFLTQLALKKLKWNRTFAPLTFCPFFLVN
jgi:hypothetical protein